MNKPLSAPAPKPPLPAGVAALCLSLALAACGGGGGSAAPEPAPAGDYHVFGISSEVAGQETINVVDPADPTHIVFSSAYTGYSPLFRTSAFSVNASTRAYVMLGEPLVFFVRDRQLFRVALAKPGTPTAVRVSSQTDVCALGRVAQLDTTGLDAWVWMSTAGPDGDCSAPVDNLLAVVRSSADATTAATLLAPSTYLVAGGVVSDTSGRLQWMLVNDRSVAGAFKLVAYSPTLTRVDVAGATGIIAPAVLTPGVPALGPVLADGVYLRADGQLRRLQGDATSLSLEASTYTFTSAVSGLGMSDGATFYFPDDHKLLKVQGAAAPAVLAALPEGNGSINGFSQTDSRVLVRQLSTRTATTAVSKVDGSQLTLLQSDDQLSNPRNPVGLHGETLFYSTTSDSRVGEIRRIQTDGTGDTLVKAGVHTVGGGVGPATGQTDVTKFFFGAPTSLLYCTPAAGAADCRDGMLSQLDLASQATTPLGRFVTNAAPAWRAQAGGWGGPAGIVVSSMGLPTAAQPGYSRRDMWLASPGQANSLRRVTHTMP